MNVSLPSNAMQMLIGGAVNGSILAVLTLAARRSTGCGWRCSPPPHRLHPAV